MMLSGVAGCAEFLQAKEGPGPKHVDEMRAQNTSFLAAESRSV